jgi:hypothetical protein
LALRFCVKRSCSTRKVVDRQDAACPRGSRLSTCRALSLKDCTRRGPWTATCPRRLRRPSRESTHISGRRACSRLASQDIRGSIRPVVHAQLRTSSFHARKRPFRRNPASWNRVQESIISTRSGTASSQDASTARVDGMEQTNSQHSIHY